MGRRREGRAGGIEADDLNPRRCPYGVWLAGGAHNAPTVGGSGLGNRAPGIAQPGNDQVLVLLHGFSVTRRDNSLGRHRSTLTLWAL